MGRFRHYRNLHRTEGRLRQLLRDFRFAPLGEVLPAQPPSAVLARAPSAAVA
jgi:hypothetical protein